MRTQLSKGEVVARDSVFPWVPSTLTNKPIGENLRARHVSDGDSVWDLIGHGFFGRYDWIALDVTRSWWCCQFSVIPMVVVF